MIEKPLWKKKMSVREEHHGGDHCADAKTGHDNFQPTQLRWRMQSNLFGLSARALVCLPGKYQRAVERRSTLLIYVPS